jgi:hypothetical protein
LSSALVLPSGPRDQIMTLPFNSKLVPLVLDRP